MASKGEQKFKRDIENGSHLEYVRKMKVFYEGLFSDLSSKIGQESEEKVVVTEKMLHKIEERLSEFEKEEKEIIHSCRRLIGEVEGITA
jgi:hypothetical protein